MADITKLRTLVETYGIAVRAGVVTPTLDDEIKMRELIGLPPITAAVRASWAETGGIRQPITLAKESPPPAGELTDEA
jgi:hypothetical protein